MTTVLQPSTATTGTQWHVNQNSTHTTRHPEPDQWSCTWEVERFTEGQKLHGTAIHEAAHAVLLCVAGVPIHGVTVRTMTEADPHNLPSGETDRGSYSVDLMELLDGLAAGERAEDRWLRETGMWTVRRAWAVERHASGDRRMAADTLRDTVSLDLTYGASSEWFDLTRIHHRADRAIDRHWASITALAEALILHRHLDAQQIASVAGISNPAV